MTKEKEVFTKLKQRQLDTAIDIHSREGKIQDAMFQHSVLCQTYLPYRNPGDNADIWQHTQGNVTLAVQANKAFNPETKAFEFVGVPYGAKARLILSYINTEAVKNNSKIIDVEGSMSAFIKRMGLNTDGRTIEEVKNQLRRLATSVISLGYTEDGKNSRQVNLGIVKAFELWFPKNDNQRVLWNSRIELTDDYFHSLVDHAIPLDERALKALSNNAMALDIYVWLTQRLHRIQPGKPQFITWAGLKDQFGRGYDRMDKFKAVFRKTLAIVKLQYLRAKIEEETNKGFWLHCSPSPIELKIYSIPKLGNSATV